MIEGENTIYNEVFHGQVVHVGSEDVAVLFEIPTDPEATSPELYEESFDTKFFNKLPVVGDNVRLVLTMCLEEREVSEPVYQEPKNRKPLTGPLEL